MAERQYRAAAVERAMKVQEVIMRAMAKQMTWWQAAEILAFRFASSSGNDGYCRLGVIHSVHIRAAFAAVMVDVQHINCPLLTAADPRL